MSGGSTQPVKTAWRMRAGNYHAVVETAPVILTGASGSLHHHTRQQNKEQAADGEQGGH